MTKSLCVCCAMLACGLSLAGCDGEEMALGIDSAPGALVDDAETEAPVMGGDGPSTPVSLRWMDMVAGDTVAASGLVLEVTSLSQNDYEVAAKLACNGLINKDAEVVLESVKLPAGESVVLHVDAGDIPIQTVSGAAQARFELVLSRETEAGTVTRRMLTPAVYYRHGAGYKGLQVFDERALMEQHDGKLSGVAVGIEAKGAVLGRVIDVADGFVEVKALDDSLAVKQDGKIIGWETGMDISIGVDGELEEVVK